MGALPNHDAASLGWRKPERRRHGWHSCRVPGTIPDKSRKDLAINSISVARLTPHSDAPATTYGNRYDSAWLHRLIGGSRLARSLSIGLLARIELAFLGGHKEADVLATIKHARKGRESLLSGNESFMLYSLARGQRGLPGEMAEVGVYQGCSAKIISTASDSAPLHLFDTYAGLPNPDADEHDRMREGHYASSLESVQAYLSDRSNLSFYQGIFPGTAGPVTDRQFSFVHLDVDLKSSTLGCLEFFYPRMVPGGVILTHDYSYLHGVRAAFSEFLADRPERPIELPTSQAMLIKL